VNVPNLFSENKVATLRKKPFRRIERRRHLSNSFPNQRTYFAVYRRIRRIADSCLNYPASCSSTLGCIGLGCSSLIMEIRDERSYT